MTKEAGFLEGLGITAIVWGKVFRWCQWLLIGFFCIAFLADFFAKSLFSLHLLAIGFPAALLLLAIGMMAWVRREGERKRWYQPFLLLVWLLLFGSVLSKSWPMSLSFAASAPALERLAAQVAAGKTPLLPTRAGAYLIRAVETQPVSGGTAICLWNYPTRSHRIGFVRSPIGVIPPGNQWTHSQISPNWHHFAAD